MSDQERVNPPGSSPEGPSRPETPPPAAPSAYQGPYGAGAGEPPAPPPAGAPTPPPAAPPPAHPSPPGAAPPVETGGAGGGMPPAGAEPFPWENRGQLGFLKAFTESLGLLVRMPRKAFERVAPRGDFGSPLLWVVIISVIFALLRWALGFMFVAPFAAFMPHEFQELMPGITALMTAGGLINVFFMPVLAIIGVFIWSAILHLSLMLVGGLGKSEAGYDGTFRTASYAWTTQLVQVIPFIGPFISIIWSIVLTVIGCAVLHRTTNGTATLAVLIPALLLCVCISVIIFFAVGAIVGLSRGAA